MHGHGVLFVGEISFFKQIRIYFPKTFLILGLWWSTFTATDTNGYISNIAQVNIKDFYNNSVRVVYGSFLTFSQDPGNTNLDFKSLPVPLLTSELLLLYLTYTAQPRGGNPLPNFDDGHTILFQLELFGCDNYDLNAGLFHFELSVVGSYLSVAQFM